MIFVNISQYTVLLTYLRACSGSPASCAYIFTHSASVNFMGFRARGTGGLGARGTRGCGPWGPGSPGAWGLGGPGAWKPVGSGARIGADTNKNPRGIGRAIYLFCLFCLFLYLCYIHCIYISYIYTTYIYVQIYYIYILIV